ncbi:MAG: hypothetical protein ABFD75_12475 [Smithella sp.]
MSSSAVKRKLSGSTDGKGIKIGSSPATTIHTAVSGTTAGTFDEVWLWAYNSHTANVVLTVQFGGETSPDNDIKVTIPYKSGLIPVIPGLILQNGAVVKAYADTADVVTLTGFVNSMTD